MLTLNELLIKRINNIITEECGIFLELDNEANRIYNSIITNLNGKKFTKRNDGIYLKTHTENSNLLGKKITIQISNYWFKNVLEKENFLKTHYVPVGYLETIKTICIPLYSVGNNDFNKTEFLDTLYHEMEHFLQISKMGHGFGSEKLYSTAITNLYSKDKIENALATIIYTTTPSEQDAMINGMFGSLKNTTLIELDEKIKQIEAYLWYEKLYSSYLRLKKCQEETIIKYLKPYNKTLSWFLKTSKNGIKRFENKIARIIFKLKKDKQLNENFRPYFSLKSPQIQGQLYWLK